MLVPPYPFMVISSSPVSDWWCTLAVTETTFGIIQRSRGTPGSGVDARGCKTQNSAQCDMMAT
jgi:hypothetical protein